MTTRVAALLGFTFLATAIAQDRMPPIPADKMTDAQKKSVHELLSTPRGGSAPTGPFIPLMRSPELMDRLQRVGEYLRFQGSLDGKLREMTILMTSRQIMQQYEWNAHYPLAVKAGMRPEIGNAIAAGRRPEGLSEDEETVYNFVAELIANKSVSDPTYARMKDKFGDQAIVDVTALYGYYSTIGLVMNVARTPAQAESSAPKLMAFPR